MGLLEGRAKRLNELLEIAAPTDMIWKEIQLLSEAAKPFAPKSKSWSYNKGQEGQNESKEFQSIQSCATG